MQLPITPTYMLPSHLMTEKTVPQDNDFSLSFSLEEEEHDRLNVLITEGPLVALVAGEIPCMRASISAAQKSKR